MRSFAAVHNRRRSSVHTQDLRNLSFGVENNADLVKSLGEKALELQPIDKKQAKRLNATQLEDLFRRLDINNDNELDLEEFLIVIQKLDVGTKTKELDKNFLAETFQQADLDRSGKLSLEEFLVAYDIFFNKKTESAVDDQVVFCQAIRYGRIGNGYIMQSYSGSGLGRNVTFHECVHLFPEKPSAMNPISENKVDEGSGSGCESQSQWSFDDLIAMIEADSQRNLKRNEQNILWWVDLTCEEKSAGIVNLMIHKFGVPRELEESLHSNRLSSLSDERLGFGVNTMRSAERGRGRGSKVKPPVKSFNVTVQSIWLKNLPVIQIQPDWIYRCDGRLRKWLMSLYVRFAPFLSYSHSSDHEKVGFIRHVAESLSNHCHHSQDSGLAVPPPPRHQNLDFLLKPHDAEKRGLPVFEANTLSLHLLDLGLTGSTPNCLLTFNRIEDEADINPKFRGMKLQTAGAVGRTKTAARSLLIHVIQAGGVSASGNLVDSSINLLLLLTHLTHEVTLSHLTDRLTAWMTAIDLATKDLATTKQYFHIRSLLDMISVASDYVNPFKTSLVGINFEDESTLLGKDISKIALLSEGDPHLDFKGVQHWEDRLRFIQSKVLDIKEEYRTKLDEQRNFWGFILALFSVFTFPATFTTGYWGMNFENMSELSPDYFQYFPGVKFMWGVNLFVYSLLFIFIMKYRIAEQAL